MEKMTNDGANMAARPWLVLLAVLAGVGVVVAADLALLHWQVHNLPGHVSFCAISEGFNCDTVALSPAAMFLTLPVAVWAVLFFFLVVVLSVWGCLAPADDFPCGLLLTLFSVALGGTVYLALTSHLVILSACLMCMILYLVNLASAGIMVWAGRKLAFGTLFSLAAVCAGLLGGTLVFSLANLSLAGRDLVLAADALFFLAMLVAGWQAGRQAPARFLKALLADVRRIVFPLWRGVLLFGLAAAVLAALLIFYPQLYAGRSIEQQGQGEGGLPTGHTAEGHPWIGAERPELVIIEYSDYECPFCREAHQRVRQLVTENSGWLRLVHVHVPLDMACNPMIRRPFHRNACACARAAICADKQGAFWRMNDTLFAHRCNLDEGGLTVLAGRLGLDAVAMRKCLSDAQTHERLQADLRECASVAQECRESGMAFGTPTFTVGGRVVVGLKDMAFWQQLIEELRLQKTGQ